MSGDDRWLATPFAGDQVQVAVTDAGCGDLDPDLALLRRIQRDVFKDERLSVFVANGGLQAIASSTTTRRIPPRTR